MNKTGIYAYWDNELSQYAYVGKDSNINILDDYLNNMGCLT